MKIVNALHNQNPKKRAVSGEADSRGGLFLYAPGEGRDRTYQILTPFSFFLAADYS